ncbi:MAG: hypothetical protein LW806_03970 [Planctomycetaceae bacterium]|jgi:hypothetical protein|nr:hypothetical protein [Planctomycetaceae bacterium]
MMLPAVDTETAAPATSTLPEVLEALPTNTVVYLALLIATYALHAVFMNYTFGGMLWTAVAALRGRYSEGAPRDTLATVVRDWLPSAVSAAVTAGIAPLLFVQIVYQRSFYTANILLFNRWMALLPALIVAVYAMYVVKAHGSAGVRDHGRAAKFLARGDVKSAAAVLAALLIGYVGLAFIENHLLSLAPETWRDRYVEGSPALPAAPAWIRLAMWALGALPTFAALAAWQLRRGAGGANDEDRARASRPLALLALTGAIGSLVLGTIVWSADHGGTRLLDDSIGRLAFGSLAGALAVGGAAWITMALHRRLSAIMVALAVSASLVAILAHAVLREGARLLALAGTPAAAREPSGLGGLAVFLVFLVISAGAIAWIVRAVARALPTTHRA